MRLIDGFIKGREEYLLNHEVYSEYGPEVESFVLPRIFA